MVGLVTERSFLHLRLAKLSGFPQRVRGVRQRFQGLCWGGGRALGQAGPPALLSALPRGAFERRCVQRQAVQSVRSGSACLPELLPALPELVQSTSCVFCLVLHRRSLCCSQQCCPWSFCTTCSSSSAWPRKSPVQVVCCSPPPYVATCR